MNEPAKDRELVIHLTTQELSVLIQDAVRAAMKAIPQEDHLLTVAEVCKVLSVSSEWVYHNVKRFSFVRKIGGQLRFSSNALQRYIESTKFTVKGG